MSDPRSHEHDVAVVGLACRFPGAANAEEFWRNLRDGVESTTFFSDQELLDAGVPPAVLQAPGFVKAAPVMDGYDLFDARFFGISPREAALLDPQHRVFLELAWHALEDAGYDPERHEGAIGLFAGMSMSSYLLFNLLENPRAAPLDDSFQLMIGTDKDFLGTRVSYHLDLRGPSLDVQTGCSTSLVAVHLGCESLLSFQSDLVLAGGVSIQVPSRWGYPYQEGGVASPDGRTRAFDARGQGTIFGSGAGIVVLKRMTDALEDGDTVRAVIRGSAINNDGSAKIGYTAPGVDGQAEVIARAQAIAGVDPQTVSYVEAHGTGTALGDPAEVAALRKAFGEAGTAGRGCGLGSVKTNIGHLDAAAGIAGLIKTVLALQHRQLPPSLNYESPNPEIDFGAGAFFVNDQLRPWEHGGGLRRAGVSSFGIGGTNAHVVVEEAPKPRVGDPGREWMPFVLSARSQPALEAAAAALAELLRRPDVPGAADVAYTLQVGRKRFSHRRVIVGRSLEDLAAALEGDTELPAWSGVGDAEARPVVFMFPGGGAQHVDMGRDLYREEPVFRREIDRCAGVLHPLLGIDPLGVLYPPSGADDDEADERMRGAAAGLPLLFCVEYALARLWMSWGIEPEAMIGHSLGEYVAACLAGVFTLEDALALVVLRGRLIEGLPSGSMLSVPLSETEARSLLGESLSLAALNGPGQCVIAGPEPAVEALAARLDAAETEYRRIQVRAAGHSSVMEPIVPRLREHLERVDLRPPEIPYVSNLSGRWIRADEATDPAYWARHLRETVRFGDGVALLAQEPERIFLEVGPGRALSTLAGLQLDRQAGQAALASMRHPRDADPDGRVIAATLGKLWLLGAAVDWSRYHQGERRLRVPLPGYPFERTRHWIDPLAGERRGRSDAKTPRIDDWFYLPSWRGGAPVRVPGAATSAEPSTWLVLTGGEVGDRLAARAEADGHEVVRVRPGAAFQRTEGEGGGFVVDPGKAADYRRLLDALEERGGALGTIVHAWSLSEAGPAEPEPGETLRRGYFSLLYLAQALASRPTAGAAGGTARPPVRLHLVSDRLFAVAPGDRPIPEKAMALSPCLVVPQEVEGVRCRAIDAGLPASEEAEVVARRLYAELGAPEGPALVALRGPHRWVRCYEPQPLPATEAPPWPLREGGTYLLTGGLGGVGLLVARHLAATRGANLVLLGRNGLPERDRWPERLRSGTDGEAEVRRIRAVTAIEEAGGTVRVVAADVADRAAMAAALAEARTRFGRIDGVFHAAGSGGAESVVLLPDMSATKSEVQFRAKVEGTRVLAELLDDDPPDFVVLFSSNVSVLGGLGSIAYTAANLFLDAFAAHPDRWTGETRWLSVNWDGWLLEEGGTLSAGLQTTMDRYAMAPSESVEALTRVATAAATPQVVVSTGDLEARLELWGAPARSREDEDGEPAAVSARPTLGTAYVPPENEVEEVVARVWQELLGIDEVGVEDNFFDLGGNSLIGLRMISRLTQELGVEIGVTKLFEGPTVRALARVLAGESAAEEEYEKSRSRGARRREKRRRRRLEEVAE